MAGKQVSENREPQNTESAGDGNVEGKENFSIRNSLFDIRYSKQEKLTVEGFLYPVSVIYP
jgi:hypothetical protein